MGLIKTGMTLGAGYYMVKKATGAVEKHDQAKMQYQPQNNPQYQPYQQQPMQPQPGQPQSSRAVDGRQTYGKYIAPDGSEHILYEPLQQFQGQQYQQPQPQLEYQAPRGLENQRKGSRSPSQSGYFPPASTTPPPYQSADRKN